MSFSLGEQLLGLLIAPGSRLLTLAILTVLRFPPIGRVFFCGCVCMHMWKDNLRGLPACFPTTGIMSTYHMSGFLCGCSRWNSGPTVGVAGTVLTELTP